MQRLRAPASSANLGPGFDALGLALNLHLECRFRPAAQLQISVNGCDSEQIPCDPSNLIWTTATNLASRLGRQLPAIELEIQNQIPLGKGLGSSAAALVAGVVLTDMLLDLGWSRTQVLDEAARLEGHPDNVGACVLGGLVASATDSSGQTCAIRLDLPEQCKLALIIPDGSLSTHKSRAALPDMYSRADLVFNLQRTALLVAALATGTIGALRIALHDRAHQPYRAALVPELERILACTAPGLLGCTLSGAGPAVLVFYENGFNVQPAFAAYLRNALWMPIAVSSAGYERSSL
jgi:homoserine kinase